MFDYAQSVFQHPNYDGELTQLYRLRKQKYTISEAEAGPLYTLLNTGICRNLFRYDEICMSHSKKGYKPILDKIEKQIANVHEHNRQILKHPLKRLLPSLFTRKVGKKVSVAYEFLKYHHYNYMALEYPDLAFNRALGCEDNWKRYETFPKRFTVTNKASTHKKFSANKLKSFLSGKKGFLFGHPVISELYDAFDRKIKSVNSGLNGLNIIRDKKTIRAQIAQGCKEKYANLGGNPETPFIKRLASFLGFARKKKEPIRNLFIQEVKVKIENGPETLQEKAKAMVSFTKKLPASNNIADYSVSEHFRGRKPRYNSFVLADTPPTMPGDIDAKKFMPKPNVTISVH